MYFVENDEYFVRVLEALHKLFERSNVSWKNQIRKDIECYLSNGSVEQHRNSYGGMGSINDVIICSSDINSINTEAALWLNNLYMKLLSLSAKISLQIQKEKVVSLDKIKKEYRFPATDIHGWKCMECNYGEISQSSVEAYLAHSMLPYIIIKSMIENSLEKLVDDCMEVNIEDVETKRQELAVAAEKSNISLKQNPIRPCCRCGGSNTSIFRWRLLDKETPTGEKYKVLEPSKSNIRYKK